MDPIDTLGGSERYLFELAELLDAPIYTMSQTVDVNRDIEIIEFDTRKTTDILLKGPYSYLTQLIAYQNFEVPPEHDAVITSTEHAMQLIHHPFQRRYHMMHTPPRWVYDQTHEHNSTGLVEWLNRGVQSIIRRIDQTAANRVDDFIVNSEVVGRRLKTYYNRVPSEIIYPPVETSAYHHDEESGFLLYLGRLAPNKRVRGMLEAVSGTDYRLKVAGTGPLEDELQSKYESDSIEFLGYVSEDRKHELLAQCDALLFNAAHEDFGIVPIEALASGKPVVAVEEGFTKYQIEHGVNGILYERGPENLRHAIEDMYSEDWDVEEIQQTAEQYDKSKFDRDWLSIFSS